MPFARLGLSTLLFVALNANAGTPICVDTGIGLRAAMIGAGNNLVDDEIRIRQGTLTLFDNTLPYDTASPYKLEISGGWTGPNGQCTVQSGGPASTVIDGQGNRQLFLIRLQAGSTGEISLSNLTVTGSYRASMYQGSSIDIELQQDSQASALIERVIVRDNDPGNWGPAVRLTAFGSSSILMRNTLVAGNHVGFHGAVTLISGYSGQIALVNNTVADNVHTAYGDRPGTGISLSGGSTIELINNVVIANLNQQGLPSDVGIEASQTAARVLLNNHIGQLNGAPTLEAATTSGLAVFDPVMPYRPIGSGLLVDSGFSDLRAPSDDLAGADRTLSAVIDRGAYENDRLFADGFSD